MNLEWDLGSIIKLNGPHETESDDETESYDETESEYEIKDPREGIDINISYRTLTEAKLVNKNNNILIKKGKFLKNFIRIFTLFSYYFYEGYVNLPIFKKIDYRSCIPDILHMFLRITDILEEYLLEEINEAELKKKQ